MLTISNKKLRKMPDQNMISRNCHCLNYARMQRDLVYLFVITKVWHDKYFLFIWVFRTSTHNLCLLPYGEPSDTWPWCGETPKSTLVTLVQSSLIKACAFFCYRQVHLQTTIHQTSAPSLQACNKLSKSDLWLQSFRETEWSVSIACIFYPSPFISLWMNSAP